MKISVLFSLICKLNLVVLVEKDAGIRSLSLSVLHSLQLCILLKIHQPKPVLVSLPVNIDRLFQIFYFFSLFNILFDFLMIIYKCLFCFLYIWGFISAKVEIFYHLHCVCDLLLWYFSFVFRKIEIFNVFPIIKIINFLHFDLSFIDRILHSFSVDIELFFDEIRVVNLYLLC